MQPLLIFAAGKSSRMGHPKGLLDYAGHPLIIHQLSSFYHARGRSAVLVLGKHANEYISTLRKYQSKKNSFSSPELHIKCVHITQDNAPPFVSIQAGLTKALEAKNKTNGLSWVFLAPVDLLPIHWETYRNLNNFATQNPQLRCIKPQFNQRNGHPVMIHQEFARQIVTSNTSHRLDHLIQKMPQEHHKCFTVQDRHVCTNLNYPKDVEEHLPKKGILQAPEVWLNLDAN